MAAIADLERFLERLFERTSARLFRSRIQDVQVQRRVERAMEAGRTGRGASTVVPNRFRVRLNPADLDDLAGRSGGHEALAASLADRALAFARLHAYHLAARPSVSVVADPIVERGTVEVDASVSKAVAAPRTEPPAPASVLEPVQHDDLAALVAPAVASMADAAGPDLQVEAPVADEADAIIPPHAAEPEPRAPLAPSVMAAAAPPPSQPAEPRQTSQPHASLRHAADQPYAIRPAAPPPTRALLRVSEPGGREREVRVEEQPLTLGRAPDNGLVIADARVSRHHGRFQNRHGTLVYTDLGSTNGTRVNGIRVDEIVLGAGDRLQLGDAVVVVEQLPR